MAVGCDTEDGDSVHGYCAQFILNVVGKLELIPFSDLVGRIVNASLVSFSASWCIISCSCVDSTHDKTRNQQIVSR